MAAIAASGDRSERLREVTVPTLVIHGRDDTLISPTGGVRTAELIPTATCCCSPTWATTCPSRCGR